MDSDPIPIVIGRPPTASITLPIDGSLFSAGETVSYAGGATDPDEALGPDAFEWVIDLTHAGDPQLEFGPFSGASGDFNAPASGYPYGNSAMFRVNLTVTDSDGLSDSTFVDIFPDLVTVTLDTFPSGLDLIFNAATVATPFVFQEAKGFVTAIDVPSPQCLSDVDQSWASWSDGGTQAHDVTVPATDVTYS